MAGRASLVPLLLLLASAAACSSRRSSPAPVYGAGEPTEYFLAFHFAGYPPLLCGYEMPKGRDVDANNMKLRIFDPPSGELLCKFQAPKTPDLAERLTDLAYENSIAVSMDYMTVYKLELREYICIRYTNISEHVFDFVMSYGNGSERKEHCNFKYKAWGAPFDSSYPVATLTFHFPGLPMAACRPWNDPSADMKFDLVRPFFYAFGFAEMPFGCSFRREEKFKKIPTEQLILLLARQIDMDVMNYVPGEYFREQDREVMFPEVVLPFVNCQPGEGYRWQVQGPSGRSVTCRFVRREGPPVTFWYAVSAGRCDLGYQHCDNMRCCSYPLRHRRSLRNLAIPYAEESDESPGANERQATMDKEYEVNFNLTHIQSKLLLKGTNVENRTND